jgi:two-component system KDP operon response regulator KdpE
MKSATILVVDDEPQIRRVMRATLTDKGYPVIEARDGQEAIDKFRNERPDLILLDMNMPGMNGLQVCHEIRALSQVPIIMLTVRNAEKDKVRALDAGADDYVVKPFGIQELLARINAVLRRTTDESMEAVYTSPELTLDFDKRQIIVRGREVHFTPKEFEVLKYLVASHGKPISHRKLLQAVWGPEYGDETESLRVVVNQLRKKIEVDSSKPKYIQTEPWIGYRFNLLAGESARGEASADEKSKARNGKDSPANFD